MFDFLRRYWLKKKKAQVPWKMIAVLTLTVVIIIFLSLIVWKVYSGIVK